MSGIFRLILLMALAVCISEAQLHSSESCLCQNVRPKLLGSRTDIKDIQIYRETAFCPRVEIQVTMKNGLRYCLDPISNVSRRLIRFLKK